MPIIISLHIKQPSHSMMINEILTFISLKSFFFLRLQIQFERNEEECLSRVAFLLTPYLSRT